MSLLLRLFYAIAPKAIYSWPLRNIPPGNTAVDIGAGPGTLAALLEARYQYVIALDIDEKLLRRWQPRRGDRIVASACNPPLRPSTADTAIFHDSLHHLQDPHTAVHEACRLLKPGGLLAVFDFDAEKPQVKILRIAERLAGFPANFLPRHHLARLAQVCGPPKTIEGPAGAIAVLAHKHQGNNYEEKYKKPINST